MSTRVSEDSLRKSLSDVRSAAAHTLEKAADATLEQDTRRFHLGAVDACDDITTDLGSLLIVYGHYDDATATMALGNLLHTWSRAAQKHRAAHDGMPRDCMPQHRGAAWAYLFWAASLLETWAGDTHAH